jgi:hypothetical protein
MLQPTLEVLRRRIAQTAAWCAGRVDRANLEHCLRSPALAPPRTDAGQVIVSPANVEDVASRRAALAPVADSARVHPGRLLVFFADQTLSEGASAVESGFFFDDDNAPPWDTWILGVGEDTGPGDPWCAPGRYVVCWIPAELFDVVEQGLAINHEECVMWADAAGIPYLDELSALY